MQKLILIIIVVCCGVPISTQQNQELPSSLVYETQSCNVNLDVTYDYRSTLYKFPIQLFKSIAIRSNFNFVTSPTSIWIMLAAIAEGADPLAQQKLFRLLNLPNDPCIRQLYYQLATTRAFPSNDVNIKSTRVLLIDDGSTVSPSWYDYVVKNSLLDVVTAPIRYNSIETANEIKRIMSARLPRLNLSGNSVLLDTMDYNGLWTTAFADAVIERAPFYNQKGEVGRVKRRARLSYVKELNAKILELPVGSDERYRMLFAVIIGNGDLTPLVTAVDTDLVLELIASLRPSNVQIDVAIPRMVITSEIDVRVILEDLGVNDLWTDPAVTRYISNPPALPSSFVQRSTLVLNNTGLEYEPLEQETPYNTRTGLEPVLGRDFIADRPFVFGLFDVETYTCLMAALPQFTINSELDAKTILEDLGVTNLWIDPEATRYIISNPPALPSSYVQRATMTLNKYGVILPPIAELRSHQLPSSPEESFWSEFIADRPFMFGLFDTETYTCIIASMYTQLTYPN